MISFSDWNKKDKNTDYEIVKSRSGLPMFVLEPPDSLNDLMLWFIRNPKKQGVVYNWLEYNF